MAQRIRQTLCGPNSASERAPQGRKPRGRAAAAAATVAQLPQQRLRTTTMVRHLRLSADPRGAVSGSLTKGPPLELLFDRAESILPRRMPQHCPRPRQVAQLLPWGVAARLASRRPTGEAGVSEHAHSHTSHSFRYSRRGNHGACFIRGVAVCVYVCHCAPVIGTTPPHVPPALPPGPAALPLGTHPTWRAPTRCSTVLWRRWHERANSEEGERKTVAGPSACCNEGGMNKSTTSEIDLITYHGEPTLSGEAVGEVLCEERRLLHRRPWKPPVQRCKGPAEGSGSSAGCGREARSHTRAT